MSQEATEGEPGATQSLTWEEAARQFDAQRAQRKRVVFDVEGGSVVFVIKQLTQTERDRVEEQAIRRTDRRLADEGARIDVGAVKRGLIRAGVVEGPPGFTATDANIAALPVDMRDRLADAIDEFSKLPEETRLGFRPRG